MKESVNENIFSGNAMIRRAEYMYGSCKIKGKPKGKIRAMSDCLESEA